VAHKEVELGEIFGLCGFSNEEQRYHTARKAKKTERNTVIVVGTAMHHCNTLSMRKSI